jgi:hypothetical protein
MEYVMPNWCCNELAVIGKSEEVERFYNSFKDTNEFFENNIPTPKELADVKATFSKPSDSEESNRLFEKYGATDWYYWRINNWGTKWDISELQLTEEDDNGKENLKYYCFRFDTAWSPPEEGIRKLSELYKDVLFHLQFEEPGMCFEGYYKCMNGVVLSQLTVESYTKIDQITDNYIEEYETSLVESQENLINNGIEDESV